MNDGKVYVVVYVDHEDGCFVGMDVFREKSDAIKQIDDRLRLLKKKDLISFMTFEEHYNADGDLVFFRNKDDDSVLYECFLREEAVQ